MDRDPGEFERHDGADTASSQEDARLDAYLASLPPCPGLPSTDEEVAADEQARKDIAAGRFVAHEDVAEWLKTWGTTSYKPMPREWLK